MRTLQSRGISARVLAEPEYCLKRAKRPLTAILANDNRRLYADGQNQFQLPYSLLNKAIKGDGNAILEASARRGLLGWPMGTVTAEPPLNQRF